MVELINPQKLPTDHTQDANGLHCHQKEDQRLHRNQGPNDHERKLITRRLALIFHAHRCISKDKSSVKNFRTVQTAVSTYSILIEIFNKL